MHGLDRILVVAGPAEREDLTNQVGGTLGCQANLIEVTREFGVLARCLACEPGKPVDACQDVVEVVRDPAGQRAHSLQLLGLSQLKFELQPLLGGFLPFRYVPANTHEVSHPPSLVFYRRNRELVREH